MNWLDETKPVYIYREHSRCCYLSPNPNYDPLKPVELESSHNLQYLKCYHHGTKINVYNGEKYINYGDDKHYCISHKRIMVKNYKKEILNKIKEDKLKLKEEEKKKLKEEKQKLKEEKLNLKKDEKQNLKMKKLNDVTLNELIESISEEKNDVITENIGCLQLLKTGPNKDKQCGCKIFNNNMCKRHYNLFQKT